jgi:CxxC motif-containing protein
MVLLDDAMECHGCGHVLVQQSAPPLKRRTLPSDSAAQDDMEICTKCGEHCRTGLVRCWNCSAFLRPEIEASYLRMRATGQYNVEHVELPIIEASHITEEDSLQRRVSTPDSYLASHPYSVNDSEGGDDFELSSEAQFGESDDDSFDLNENLLSSDQSDGMELLADSREFRLDSMATELPAETGSGSEAEYQLAPPIQSGSAEISAKDSASELPMQAETPAAQPRSDHPVVEENAHGDELLKIAADEEKDIQQVRKSLRSKDTFVIFCPSGCRIRVKEKHRGKSGKCPRCQAEFVVPRKQAPKNPGAASDTVVPVVVSRYKKWIEEIRLHIVDPLKLRIKVDSLLNECQSVDLGFSEGDVLIATLIAGKFGANVKKSPPVRLAMIDHFLKQGSVETLAIAAKKSYSLELVAQFTVAQPAPVGTESLFGDIPVFGSNRIAVRIPKLPDDPHPKYLSFCLSEFRTFVENLRAICGIEGFGANTQIPLKDEYLTRKCKYSEAPVRELVKVNYYEKDPGFKLEVTGWKCASCGIVISEATRLEKKLGGVNGKAIAKAKCPSCTKKYGSLPLYQLAGGSSGAEQPDEAAASSV